MGEIRSFTKANLERQGEVRRGLKRLGNPVGFRGHEEGGKIEEVGFRCGEFEIGDKRVHEGESFAVSGFFGGGIGVKKEEIGAAGKSPSSREPGLNPELLSSLIDRDEVGFFAFA